MILGFTGTMQGMTPKQHVWFRHFLIEHRITGLHHGVCKGADEQFHHIAESLLIPLYLHPSTSTTRVKDLTSNTCAEPKQPLERDRDIVIAGKDGLLAASKCMFEELRSGTWTTVRMARKANRHIWIVFPDGTHREELPLL